MELIGHTRFVFPFANYPCDQGQPYHLYSLFWEAVNSLMNIKFHVQFVLFDGAVANRSFFKMLFTGNPVDKNMEVINIFRQDKTILGQKYVIKTHKE